MVFLNLGSYSSTGPYPQVVGTNSKFFLSALRVFRQAPLDHPGIVAWAVRNNISVYLSLYSPRLRPSPEEAQGAWLEFGQERVSVSIGFVLQN